MTPPTEDILTPRLCLRSMSGEFFAACLRGEWRRAEAILGLKLADEWLSEQALMELRWRDCQRDPAYVPWSLRAIGLRASGEMIGHIGFHTRPDPPYLQDLAPNGVELGYTISAGHRRRGYAAEAIRGMMGWALEQHGARKFVVSISPANVASTGLAAKLGFKKIGGHEDEIDGYEDVYVLAGDDLLSALSPPNA